MKKNFVIKKLHQFQGKMIEIVFLAVFFSTTVAAVDFSREEAGTAVGLMFQCPEYSEPAVMPPASCKSLYITVMGSDRRKMNYDYYHVRDLAQDPGIDFRKRTVLYVSGHFENYYQSLIKNIGNIYRDLGYNVMILNTLEFNGEYYPVAASFVRPIGKHVAEMLVKLTTLGLDPKKLVMLGHNFGAHTMSFIAKNYRQITGRNISSITALDPAGPCFRQKGPEDRLDPSDADFVLSVGTNIDGWGMATPVGHVTFYVNGGEYQPADIWILPYSLECSHIKAIFYWTAALLNPKTFLGMQCDSIQKARDGDCYDRKPFVWNSMDIFVNRSKPGIYFLPTFHRYPYSLGKAGLTKKGEKVLNHVKSLNNVAVKMF